MLFSPLDRVVCAARTSADFRQVLHDLLVPVRPELRDPDAQCDAEGRGILGAVHLASAGAGAHRPGARRVLHRRHPDRLRAPGAAADSVSQAQDPDAGHHRAGAGLQSPGPFAEHRASERAAADAGAACSQGGIRGAVHAGRATAIRDQAIGLPGGAGAHQSHPRPAQQVRFHDLQRPAVDHVRTLLVGHGRRPTGDLQRHGGQSRAFSAGCCGRPLAWRW